MAMTFAGSPISLENILNVTTPRRIVIRPEGLGWLESATNGGSFSSTINGRNIATGTNSAGTALRYMGAYNARYWSHPGSPNGGVDAGINWSRRIELRFSMDVTSTFLTNHLTHFRFGQTRNTTTLGPVSVKGVGLIFDSSNISGFVHNGTGLTTQILTANISNRYEFAIISFGTGVVQFFINDIPLWASLSTQGPIGWGGQENTQLGYMVENAGETAGIFIGFNDCHITMY